MSSCKTRSQFFLAVAAMLVAVTPAMSQFRDSRVFLAPSAGLAPEGGGTAYGAFVEVRVADKVGVGAEFFTWGWTRKYDLGLGDWAKYKYTFKDYGVYAVWHFLPTRKFDPFIGIGVLNEDVSVSWTCNFDPEACRQLGSKFKTGIAEAPIAGIRYFFSPHFSVHALATAGLYFGGAVGLTFSF